MRAALGLGTATLAAALLATFWLDERLSAPVPREIGPPPASLADAEAVAFASGSGDVHAWVAPGEPGRGGVVLAHAVRSDRRSMRARAEFLQRAGYAVLLFDAQAHGESEGERITSGWREARDATAAVAFLRAREPGSRIGYVGFSQGGAAALLDETPLEVDALVLEAVYTTLEDAFANRVALYLGEPFRGLAALGLWRVESLLGVGAEAIRPIERIGDVQAPLLLIAGEFDRRATLEQSRALFAAAPEPKTMWVVPGLGHRDFHRFRRDEYERRLLAFFEATLRAPR